MAVTSNTGTVVPVVGGEIAVTTITGGPYDNVTAYVKGGDSADGLGQLAYRLYSLVGSLTTLLAETQVLGGQKASILQWQTPGSGSGTSQFVEAGGTSYIVTVTALPTSPLPRSPVTATLAGDDVFDTVADTNISPTLVVPSFSEISSANVNGYCQFMDVSVNQTGLPQSTTITIYANNGGGSVEAIVDQLALPGPDGVTVVLRKIALPVASVYRVSVRNNTGVAISVPIAIATYSVSITSGGVVTLAGDVIGPSNANTVIKWDNVPLLLGAAPGFGTPVDAAIPIYDLGANTWRTFPLSGGATMTNAGVVTITVVPSAITPGTLFGELLTTLGPPGTPTSLPLSAQWIPPTNNPTWTQATWFVDPLNVSGTASDQNSGIDAAHAVSTYTGGILAKWGTVSPTLVQDTNITWLSSQPTGGADPVIIRPVMSNAVLTIQGTTPTIVHSGVLGGVISKNRATGQLLEADLGFAATPGQMVINTTAGKSSRAWVYQNVAGTVFKLTQPATPAVLPVSPGDVMTEVDTWANGDTFELCDMISVNIVEVDTTVAAYNTSTFPDPVQVYQLELASADGVIADDNVIISNDVNVVECSATAIVSDTSGIDDEAAVVWNCFLAAGAFEGIASGAITIMLAGAILSPVIAISISWSFDWDAILDVSIAGGAIGSLLDSANAPQSNGLVYISTGNATNVQGIAVFVAGSGFTQSGQSIVWGPGVLNGIGSARLSYTGGSATTIFINSGGLRLNSQVNANAFNPATGLWSSPIAITAANLDLAFGAGGFGGLATNVGGASFTGQGTV
jgi:hypothetical protein